MGNIQKENYLVSNFFVFFIIISSQNGIGLLGFQNIIAKNAKHDGWIVVLLIGISLQIVLWLIYEILKGDNKDIMTIHNEFFGKFFGSVASIFISIYFLTATITVFRTYLEIVQVWAFPSVSLWEISILMLLIIYYIVSGGFRVVTGICFLFAFIPSILFFLSLYFPLKFSNINNILPIFNLSFIDLIKAFKESSSIFFGFETLLIYFPLVKNAHHSKIWANIAIMFTTIIFTIVALVSLTYFSVGQLVNSKWPTLEMTKIMELPFVERFEFIFIFSWLAIIIPTISLHIWSISRIYKRLFNVKPRISLINSLVLILVFTLIIDNYFKAEILNSIVSQMGFYFIYIYIPLLFLIKVIRRYH